MTLSEAEDNPWPWMDLYDHYKAGYLPYAGGILDQPAAFGDAMRLIGQRLSETLEEDNGAEGQGRG